MKKRTDAKAVQHLEARQDMLEKQLADIKNRIYGRNNSFLPFIINKNGKISEWKLNNFIKALMKGVYGSGMYGIITTPEFKELCECFLYCTIQGFAEYDECSRHVKRVAGNFSDIVDMIRHKNNLLFIEESTLHKYEYETAMYDEADDEFYAKYINEFQWGGFFRYCDAAYYILTERSITTTFSYEEYCEYHGMEKIEKARAYGFDTVEEYEAWVNEGYYIDSDEIEIWNDPLFDEAVSGIDYEEMIKDQAEKRKQENDKWRQTVVSPEKFVEKYLRFRELFFGLGIYYRYNLFEYVEFMVDMFLYNRGLSALSEDESFAMLYHRTNKLYAAVNYEMTRRSGRIDKG